MGKLGSLFWEITAESSKFEKGLKDSKDKMGQLKSGVNDVVQGLTGFSFSSLAGAGAVVALGNAVKNAINDTVKYADTVRQMARITGESTEETSRLIQLTDDLGVSQNDLQGAMEGAARKGIAFNTESMARLADEYVALSDPVSRNTLLLDNFGRSGLNMAAAMSKGGDAIREMSDAVDKNLVLTQEQVDAAREYEIALDNLSDAIQAVKVQIGGGLIPIATTYAKSVTNMSVAQAELEKRFGSTIASMPALVALYSVGMTRLQEMNAAEKAVVESGFIQAQMITGTLNPALQSQGSTTALAVKEMENIWQASNVAVEATLAHSNAIRDLKGATDDLKTAQDNWMKGAGGDIKSELEAAGIKGEDYRLALAAIDTQMGTGFAQEQAYKDNIKLLVEEYKKGGDLGKFTGGLASMKTEFMQQDEKVIALRVHVQEYQTALDKLVEKPYTVYLNQVGNVTGNGSSSNRGNEQVGGEQYAQGGSYIIPPGYNETWPVGPNKTASSGEMVTITPANQINNNMGGITIYVSGADNPKATADAIALRLASYGKKYQGM